MSAKTKNILLIITAILFIIISIFLIMAEEYTAALGLLFFSLIIFLNVSRKRNEEKNIIES